MIDVELVGDWQKASRLLGTFGPRLRVAMDRSIVAEANFFRAKVVEGFRTQAPGDQRFTPLSPMTLAMRRAAGFGGTKALIVRADLRNSIKVVKHHVAFGVEAFVGVLRSARGSDGQDLANVAEIHEFGTRAFVVRVTPAMRKFFFAALHRAGVEPSGGAGGFKRGFLIIRIPARPFLRPVAEKYFTGAEAAARFQGRVAAALLGDFGGPGAGGGGVTGVVAAARRARAGGGLVDRFLSAAMRVLGGGPDRDPNTGRFRSRR